MGYLENGFFFFFFCLSSAMVFFFLIRNNKYYSSCLTVKNVLQNKSLGFGVSPPHTSAPAALLRSLGGLCLRSCASVLEKPSEIRPSQATGVYFSTMISFICNICEIKISFIWFLISTNPLQSRPYLVKWLRIYWTTLQSPFVRTLWPGRREIWKTVSGKAAPFPSPG